MFYYNKYLFKAGKYLGAILLFITFANPSFSQELRLTDHNTIGWFAYTGTFKITPKLAIHTEYQWRRVNGLKNWQQGLLRTGMMYAVRKDISLNAGYAFADTYPYGDFPGAFSFPEHRLYEQVVIKNPVGKIELSHRFTLEQRFQGKVTLQNGIRHTDYLFLNRIRYRFRADIPIQNSTSGKNNWSFAIQDELFIGWGKNIGANVFDQNRMAALFGYKANKSLKLEAGYINQVLQQGRRINDKAVFQYNHGFQVAANFTFSLYK